MHYFPAYSIGMVENISMRQLNNLVREIGNVHVIFNPPIDDKNKVNEDDIDDARHLGCKEPEKILNVR